jgi:hypothetical protein
VNRLYQETAKRRGPTRAVEPFKKKALEIDNSVVHKNIIVIPPLRQEILFFIN